MGLLDQLKAYVSANTPRNTRPDVSLSDVVNKGLLNPNEYNAPAANAFKDSAFGLLGGVPGVGDVASGVQAADYWNRGEKMNAGLAGLGALPFIPAMGFVGSIGKFGKFKPDTNFGGSFPEINGITRMPNKSVVSAIDNPYLTLRALQDGTYQANYLPAWGGSSKEFSVYGDNADELLQASLDRIIKSGKAADAAKQSKFNNSLLGRLQSEYGDVFSTAKSTQSKSQYITHDPSGTKIRISDHNLPLHYEQPDINLSNTLSVDDQLAAIRDYFK